MIIVHHLLQAQQSPRGRDGVSRLTAFLGLPPGTPLHLVVRQMDPRECVRDRAAEKQASRNADAHALKMGLKTRAQLTAENSFIDWSKTNLDISTVPLAC